MLTIEKLTGDMGYVKYSSKSKARKIARKLDISGTHSHEMRGKTVYMPGSRHNALNNALERRGFRPVDIPGGGGMMGGMVEEPDMPEPEDGGGGMMDDVMFEEPDLGDMFESDHNDGDDDKGGGFYG